MKKTLFFMFAIIITMVIIVCSMTSASVFAIAEEKPYKSAYVIDYTTGNVILDENSNEKYPIASMVKIMTLNLIFDKIIKENIDLNTQINISEYASSMGGSQMFLEANDVYSLSDLIKGVVVCSANDAATAIGEFISGDIDSFVNYMNEYAKTLGMNNTVFCNATGLPDSGTQYSTAKDVTLMMKKLLSYDLYYKYSKIWIENFVHPDGRITEMVNTNKLIRTLHECDAGKTGFTNEAGFCLSASARVNETRIIATLLGGENSKTRFNVVGNMLKSALKNYETKILIKKNDNIPCQIDVKLAKKLPISIYCEKDIAIFTKKGAEDNYTINLDINKDLIAPIEANTIVGKITLLDKNGKIIDEAMVMTKNNIPSMNYLDSLKKIFENWSINNK